MMMGISAAVAETLELEYTCDCKQRLELKAFRKPIAVLDSIWKCVSVLLLYLCKKLTVLEGFVRF